MKACLFCICRITELSVGYINIKEVKMKYKAAIFDLDGTLLNSLTDLTYAVNLVMDMYSLPRHTEREVASYVGSGAAKLVERAFPAGTDSEILKKATDEYKKLYLENMLRETAPYDGICEMLTKLQSRGIRVAVVSNKYYKSTKELCDLFFPNIDGCIGEMEERGIRRKPYPDMLFKMMEQLGVSPEQTVYLGDSEVDVELSRRAGVACISVTWGLRNRKILEAAGPDAFADSPLEIPEIIARLESESD